MGLPREVSEETRPPVSATTLATLQQSRENHGKTIGNSWENIHSYPRFEEKKPRPRKVGRALQLDLRL